MSGDLFSDEYKKKKLLKDAKKQKSKDVEKQAESEKPVDEEPKEPPKKKAVKASRSALKSAELLMNPKKREEEFKKQRPKRPSKKNVEIISGSPKVETADTENRVLTVFELTGRIKSALERNFRNQQVKGEISKPSPPGRSGHIYFTLKDNQAVLDCVIWKNTAHKLRYKPMDGDEVLVRGSVTVYPPSGRYQMIVEEIRPVGKGALFFKFEQLKRRFEAEGLFDDDRKKPIPSFPRCIGVISAETGAAIRDIIKVIHQRFPYVEILLAPSLVQGENAAPAIVKALKMLDNSKLPDVIILGRGGGSYEDLWAFNEEIVVRAIAACKTPVIAAIGHQRDFTLADFVADVRAATPSHAGEIVVPVYDAEMNYINELRSRMFRVTSKNIESSRAELRNFGRRLVTQNPLRQVNLKQQRIDELSLRMQKALNLQLSASTKEIENLTLRLRAQNPAREVRIRKEKIDKLTTSLSQTFNKLIKQKHEKLQNLTDKLKVLSPYNVLERGYSITMNKQGEPVKDVNDVNKDETIITKLAKGKLKSRITDKEN